MPFFSSQCDKTTSGQIRDQVTFGSSARKLFQSDCKPWALNSFRFPNCSKRSTQKDFSSLRIQFFHGKVKPIFGRFTTSSGKRSLQASTSNFLGVRGNFSVSGRFKTYSTSV